MEKTKKRGQAKKTISEAEKRFAELIADGLTTKQAAQKVFRWKCEKFTTEEVQARTLANSRRVKEYIAKVIEERTERAALEDAIDSSTPSDWNNIHQYAFNELKKIRDSKVQNARVRYQALLALEKLADPAQDINLIWRYIETIWQGFTAHCPCCHSEFPLTKIKNERLDAHRDFKKEPDLEEIPDWIDRRLYLIGCGEKRRTPHKSQLRAIKAEERHVVGLGLARGGKCNYAKDKVILADGSYVEAETLINKSFDILAYGPNGKQIKTRAFAWNNGIKPVYRIESRSGRVIFRTDNHPLLGASNSKRGQGMRTQIGQSDWVEIKNLKEKNLILVPRKINICPSTNSYSINDCKLLGYLLGDGGTTVHVTFTQLEGRTKEDFRELVKKYDCIPIDKSNLTISVKGRTIKTNHVLKLVRDWKINCKAKEKKLPDWAWKLPDEGLALVINRLYACDGWVSKKEIGISLASEELIRGVQIALLRLGINGALHERKTSYTDKKTKEKRGFKAWTLTIRSKRDCILFSKKVGIFGKEEALNSVIEKQLKAEDRIDFRETGCPIGYMWDEIKSIELVGKHLTVGISVPNYETFISSYVEHNSLCQGQLGLLYILIPGSQLWLLGRTYEDARYEFEYIEAFLYTMFYPVEKHMYNITFDKKTGDASITTRWGSELNVKSGKSKGSITGQELDAILVAEPGWVEAELFEEVRARMSSRLGRIFAFGTPKGFGNFLGRMMRMATRNMRTGKKLAPGSKLIKNGCSWKESILVYDFDAKDNPEYVLSELETAKGELTESEYASEFEGRAVSDKDKKFPFVKPSHIVSETPDEIIDCSIVLGVDQGPKNFAALLVGYDGNKIYFIDEYFDNTGDNTIKSNLIRLNSATPGRLITLKIPPEKWILSIFDTDPSIDSQLEEMIVEGRPWKTEFTFKPKNKVNMANWREEVVEYINQMARNDKLVFCPKADLLHEQLMEVIAVPDSANSDTVSKVRKNWLVSDTWRGDHVLDAMMHAVWTIYSGALTITKTRERSENIWEYLEKEQEYDRRKSEAQELRSSKKEQEIYSDVFGEEPTRSSSFIPRVSRNYYPDA